MPLFWLTVGGWLAVFGVPWLVEITPLSDFISTWCSPYVLVCLQISPFYEDTSHTGLGPTLMTSF